MKILLTIVCGDGVKTLSGDIQSPVESLKVEL